MYPSTYLNWFRRLLILGAVVAGLTASAAGARLDPGTPPDVSDVVAALSTTPASNVSRPPDVRDAADTVNAAVPDVFERYAAAHSYGSGLSTATSPVDRIVAQEQGRQRDLGLFSLGFSASTISSGLVSTPPDVQDAMAGLHTTPEGLKADGLRYRGIARVYEQLQSDKAVRPDDRPGPLGVGEPTSVPVSSGDSDFAWSDWAIGVGAGVGIALLLGIGLVVGRQQRQRVQPA